MTAIMGCTVEGQDRNYFEQWYKCLVLKPQLIDHLQTFKDYPIPLKHAARFAKIIIVLCDRVCILHIHHIIVSNKFDKKVHCN